MTTGAAIRPLSAAQERMWFLARLHPAASLFTLPVVLRLDGPLDTSALGRCLALVVRRHEVLAGRVEERAGRAVQVVAPWPERLPVTDWHPPEGDGPLPPLLRAADLPELPLPPGRMLAARLLRVAPQVQLLQLAVHHMAFDGMSARILVDELTTAYRACSRGLDPAAAMPPLPGRYADFADQQRSWLESPAAAQTLDDWRRALDGAADLDLATDRPRRLPISFRGDTHHLRLGAELTRQVGRFAADHRVTPFMTLAAVYAVSMSRRAYRATDFLLGIPRLGRERPEWAPLLGLFADLAPLRVRMPPGTTFATLVQQVREGTIRVMEKGTVPFERLVSALRPTHRDLSRLPLCPVSFQLRHDLLPAGEAGEVTVRQLPVARGVSEFEMSMYVAEAPEAPCVIEYTTDLFDAGTVAAVADEFVTLCAGLTQHPQRPIETVDHHGTHLAARLAGAVGGAASPAASVPEAFRRSAVTALWRHAVVCPEATISYRELEAASASLAHRLRAAGVRRGQVVAVAVGRDQWLPVALLGVLRSGAAFLPVDPELPPARVAAMLAIARPVAAVVAGPPPQALAGGELTVVPVTGPTGSGPPLPRLTGDDLAYVMFTSGTTGEPKAVAVPHRGIVSVAAQPGYVEIAPGDVVAQLAPVSFDAATFEIWGALLNGATLAVAPTPRMSPRELHEFARSHRVSVLHLTAGLMRVIADERPHLPSSVRHLLTGGDVVSAAHLRRIGEVCPDLRITSCYGPTEVTAFTSTSRFDPADGRSQVPVGRAIPGRELYVLDHTGRPVSPGVPGELMAGGDGLARGYLHRPGLTAERFVPHPLRPGTRLYRTGDLGRVGPDGQVEFLGRSDRQLKIRGFRVELTEVERALAGHPAVRQCLVRPYRQGVELALAAHVVADGAVTESELAVFLRDRLPPYCVPALLRCHPELPLTAEGKVDEAALAAPAASAGPRPGGDAPLTGYEELVRDTWRTVLAVAEVGVDADFFQLGGDSLLALRATAELERRAGRPVPVAALFAAPTVRGLAEWLSRAAGPDGSGPAARDSHSDLLAEVTGASPAEIAALVDAVTARDRERR